jgi:hypothetical protein
MAQEVDSVIDQLIKDLNEFKQAVRIGDEDGQNNALGLLDKVIASDRHLQQSFSKCMRIFFHFVLHHALKMLSIGNC